MRAPFIFLTFLTLSAFGSSALAEYYIAVPSITVCDDCDAPRVVGRTYYDVKGTSVERPKIYPKSRHSRRSHVTFQEYHIWAMGPAYPCSYVWVPAYVDRNNMIVCGHWQAMRCDESRYQTSPVYYYYPNPYDYPGSLDRATRDDNPNRYPDMDIDR
jgi:hypothetical protein